MPHLLYSVQKSFKFYWIYISHSLNFSRREIPRARAFCAVLCAEKMDFTPVECTCRRRWGSWSGEGKLWVNGSTRVPDDVMARTKSLLMGHSKPRMEFLVNGITHSSCEVETIALNFLRSKLSPRDNHLHSQGIRDTMLLTKLLDFGTGLGHLGFLQTLLNERQSRNI